MCPEHAFIFGRFLLSTKVRPEKGGVALNVGVVLNVKRRPVEYTRTFNVSHILAPEIRPPTKMMGSLNPKSGLSKKYSLPLH